MSLKIVLLLLIGISACVSQSVGTQPITEKNIENIQPESETSKPLVLVELFTSEGCSSCPPADKALIFLQKEQPNSQAEIVTLAFHVDYWDNLGWKDEFSTNLFTQRQQIYARKFALGSPYTPQMVVDGKYELVGSNLGKAQQAISKAATEKKAKIEIKNEDNALQINISQIPTHKDSTLYLAIAENNLASNVQRGENAGNKLEHISVVRELKMLGKITQDIDTFILTQPYQIQSNWKKENLKFVVFIQENISRKIIALSTLSL